jgi:hypothetical protein
MLPSTAYSRPMRSTREYETRGRRHIPGALSPSGILARELTTPGQYTGGRDVAKVTRNGYRLR